MNILLIQILVLLLIAAVVGWVVGLWWQRRQHNQEEEVLHSKLIASDRQLRRLMTSPGDNRVPARAVATQPSAEDQKAIDWLKEQITTLESQNTQTLETVSSRDAELDRVGEQLRTAQAQVLQLQSDVELAKAHEATLEPTDDSLGLAQQEIAGYKAQLADAQERESELQRTADNLRLAQLEIEKYQSQLKNHSQQELELKRANNELEQAQGDIRRVQAELQSAQEQAANLTRTVEDLQQAKADISQYQAELDEAKKKEAQLAQSGESLQQAQADIRRYQADLDAAKAQETELSRTTAQLQEARSAIQKYEGQLAEAKQQEDQLHTTREELLQAQNEIIRYRSELTDAKQQQTQMLRASENLQTAQEEIRQYQADLAGAKDQTSRWEQEYEAALATRKSLEQQQGDLQRKLAEREQRVVDLEAALKDQAVISQRQVEQAHTASDTERAATERMAQENAQAAIKLEQELRDQVAQVSALETERDESAYQASENLRKLERLQEEVESRESQVVSLSDALQTTQRDVGRLKGIYQGMRRRYSNKRASLLQAQGSQDQAALNEERQIRAETLFKLDQSAKTVDELEQKLQETHSVADTMRNEFAKRRGYVMNLRANLRNTQQRLVLSQQKNDVLQNERERLSALNDELRQAIIAQNQRLQDARSLRADLAAPVRQPIPEPGSRAKVELPPANNPASGFEELSADRRIVALQTMIQQQRSKLDIFRLVVSDLQTVINGDLSQSMRTRLEDGPKHLSQLGKGKVDDLQLVKGIGWRKEMRLNCLGIKRFQDLARLSETDVLWLDQVLGTEGTIVRQDWVGQSRALSVSSSRRARAAQQRGMQRRPDGQGSRGPLSRRAPKQTPRRDDQGEAGNQSA